LVPFSVRQPCSALRRRPASGSSRFGVSRSPRPRSCEPRSAACRPCGFSLLAKSRSAQLDLADVRGGSFDRRKRVARTAHFVLRAPVTHSSIDRTRLPSSAIRRTGAVGVTDAHASRPDPSNRALPLAISSPEPGHAPTRPLARCSATRRSGHRTALPDEGSSLWSPSGGAPGVAPFAGLIPRAGGRAAQVRRLNVSDISVRPGPRVVRAFASAPIYFRRGDRPPLGEHGKLEGGRSGICWLRLLGFTPVCGPIHGPRWTRIDPALGFASCRV